MKIDRTTENLREYRRKIALSQAYGTIVMPVMETMERTTVVLQKPDGSPVESVMRDYGFTNMPDPENTAKTLCASTLLAYSGVRRLVSPTEDALCQKLRDNMQILYPEQESLDPYYQNIKIPEIARGEFTLGYSEFQAGEYDMSDGPSLEDGAYGHYIPKIGIWNSAFRFPIVMQNKTPWMTVTPNEKNTMHKHIEAAHGHVLTLGLGLGYFAYMAHRKPDVTAVTIIEIDPDIIALFEAHILPQFDHPEKIKIVQADAIAYIQNLADGVFDTCFADIWRNGMDVDPYLSVKTAARHLKKTAMSYWIEDSLLGFMLQHMGIILLGAMGLPYPNMDRDPLYRFLQKLTSRTRIKNPDEMRQAFTPQYLSNLIDIRTSVSWQPNI